MVAVIEVSNTDELNELIKGDSIFCATGITSSNVLSGIKIINKSYESETLVTHKSSNYIEINDNNYSSETLVTHKNSQLKKIIKRTDIITE